MVKMFRSFSARLVPFPAEMDVSPTTAGGIESVELLGDSMMTSELTTVKIKNNVKTEVKLKLLGQNGLEKASRRWQPIV